MKFRQRFFLIVLIALSACISADKPAPTILATNKPLPMPTKTTNPTNTATPLPTITPTAIPPKELTICLGAEPDTMYIYGGSMYVQEVILEAIYDGPIDTRDFSFQPVILEKLPSLADGDARIESVTVKAGDAVVNNAGDVTGLVAGEVFRPSGCNSPECAVIYEGGAVEMDQMVVSFSLLLGLMWSDGVALTATDSIYAFNLAADPDTPVSKYSIERTISYEARDDTTIVWTGLPGYMDSTYFTNFWDPLPEHIWGQFTARELLNAEESTRTPLGWGPYIIEEWVIGHSIKMTRNPNYFRAAEGLPYFDILTFKIFGQNSEAGTQAILSGKCDMLSMDVMLENMPDELVNLDRIGELNLHITPSTVWEHLDFGILPSPEYQRPDFFSDVRVRQAIAYCIDRQAIVDELHYGESPVLNSFISPFHPLYSLAELNTHSYDPERGQQILEEVGWIDQDEDGIREAVSVNNIDAGTPFSINLVTTTSYSRGVTAKMIVSDLAKCGVELTLEQLEAGVIFADGPEGPIFGRKFDLALFAWLSTVIPSCDLFYSDVIPGDPKLRLAEVPGLLEALGAEADPQSLAYPWGWEGWNNPGYANPAFDAACKAAEASLWGMEEYTQAHLEAIEIFNHDLPALPLYLRVRISVSGINLVGVNPNSTHSDETWNIEDWYRLNQPLLK